MSHIVLFGVTGDLSRKRLIPALARAWSEGGISSVSRFVGFGRKKFSKKEFKEFVSSYANIKDAESFLNRWEYIESELDEDRGYKALASSLRKKEGNPSALIYVSLPPALQTTVASKLFKTGILKRGNGRVLAIEKPFGGSSSSAKKLNSLLLSKISEEQIYRVDHYAGKEELIHIEEAGKLGVLSFSNNKAIKALDIVFSEKGTVLGRGAFYDHVGALNDVCQNHILHMLGTVLAAPYAKLGDRNSFASVRATVLKFLKIEGSPILGQYQSFRNEKGVRPDSCTETYFNIKNKILFGTGRLSIIEKDLKRRWEGLEVNIMGGKALPEDLVSICFHGGTLTPGSTSTCIVTSRHGSKDAYQTIFEAALRGDRSRSIDIGQILAGWKYIENVKKMKPVLKIYKDQTDPVA